jgi:SMC interacting uncharacterized protein involved in chromosome segregation
MTETPDAKTTIPEDLREDNKSLHRTITEMYKKLKQLESECASKDEEITRLREQTNKGHSTEKAAMEPAQH